MKVLAIDPGNTQSAYVYMDGYMPERFGKVDNDELLHLMTREDLRGAPTVIEVVKSYGMSVGQTVFDTCIWIGRFTQQAVTYGKPFFYIPRMAVKMNLCKHSSAKDGNVRVALIDRFALHDRQRGKGTKKNPDVFYGFAADVWQAYAVGVTYLDREAGGEQNV